MLEPAVREALDAASFGHLATIGPDGAPHSAPVYVAARGEQVVFFTGPQTRKGRNIRRDPRVALSIVPAAKWFEPIVIRGQVVDQIEGDAAWEIIDTIAAKYTDQPYPHDDPRTVYVIDPTVQRVGMS
ncbi:PPOX class F420-dependent oxidoreductase [Kribbella jejuensis]|uniref:PPOX class probable F420-dependent enzyme n=1 Tax=Kribbella jejuensis TaxID=236068 RepID=A0A542EB81_9ACTN|nr:PPOX class F420-dependent oxidoreductase [Kribbella jejuensis]TQJ12608.1 PPOX class probable F420-dependent enzyme [Kribbella jejuensis]